MNKFAPMVEDMEKLAADFGRIKAVVDFEQVNAVISRAKQQEQIEAKQERTVRRKHNREACWQAEYYLKSPLADIKWILAS